MQNLMIMLETRLDNVIFRLGFARTRQEARQIVDHKHVLVNGKQVNIPSYLVKAGDTVEIKESPARALIVTKQSLSPLLEDLFRNGLSPIRRT